MARGAGQASLRLLLLLLLVAATTARPSRQLGCPECGAPPPPAIKCPAACFPISDCDFVFGPQTPTFNLMYFKNPPDYVLKNSTYPGGPAPVYPVSKPGYDSSTWTRVTLNVGPTILSVNPIPKAPLAGSCNISNTNQFYFSTPTASPSLPYLTVRTFQIGRLNFTGNCFKLFITNAQLTNADTTINLNPGDGNTIFPESKRCAIFKSLYDYSPAP